MNRIMPLAVILGIATGYFILPHAWLQPVSEITIWALYLLLIGIGISIGSKQNLGDHHKEIRRDAFVLILCSAIGSITGAAIVYMSLGGPILLGAAIGAGFGWYSLSGILLSETVSVSIGALAFLSNTIRELFALLLMPLVIKRFGWPGIAIGGATTMDTTLPIINKSSNSPDDILLALLHGMVLSALVPILVPMLAQINSGM